LCEINAITIANNRKTMIKFGSKAECLTLSTCLYYDHDNEASKCEKSISNHGND
jgi:hypothetical protein